MTIGRRIRMIRESFSDGKISMADFGEQIGVSSGAVSQWENNQRIPTNAIIRLIAKEFKINEDWLRTGKGEMHLKVTRESEIAEIASSLIKDDDKKRLQLTKIFSELSTDQIEFLYEKAKRWLEAVENGEDIDQLD